jgi:hypothetical protein
LKREDHSGEETGKQNDSKRSDANGVHLLNQIAAVERAGEDEPDGLARQDEILLEGKDLPLQGIVEAIEQLKWGGK